ncbi:MAG: ATP-binding protein [Coprococcus sp.]
MRLLTCHIENFGKLSDFSYDFADGYNAFVLPNGAGKSTFAAFIRVMFYGFAGETKRTELEKERKRYQPWQGGTYGGQLTFTADGKYYLLSRVFGRRQREIPSGYRMRIRCLTSTDFTGTDRTGIIRNQCGVFYADHLYRTGGMCGI